MTHDQRKIRAGDLVVVTMSEDGVFPFQVGRTFVARFCGGPQGPGDFLGLETMLGMPVAINPGSPLFVGMHLHLQGPQD